MNWSDENLMAYADGELEPARRSELEQAMVGDSRLRERVAQFQSQRDRVKAAFASVLDEPMPDRLSALLASAAPAPAPALVSLEAARTARHGRRPMSSWAQWGGMAASVVLGVLVGTKWPRGAAEPPVAVQDGRLVAGSAVGQALSTQLSSEPRAASGADAVAVQMSFVDKDGRFCRTFSTEAMAGLACRQGDAWAVQTVVAAERQAAGPMRQAASALPRAVLEAVDQRIDGAALDASGEKQARDRNWQR